MTTGSLYFDSEQVRGSAPAFRSLGDRLSDITTRLRTEMSAEGECWGSDSYGTSFLEGYAEPRDGAMKSLGDLATAFRGIADGLVKMADDHDAAEAANTGNFTK